MTIDYEELRFYLNLNYIPFPCNLDRTIENVNKGIPVTVGVAVLENNIPSMPGGEGDEGREGEWIEYLKNRTWYKEKMEAYRCGVLAAIEMIKRNTDKEVEIDFHPDEVTIERKKEEIIFRYYLITRISADVKPIDVKPIEVNSE